VSSWDWWYYQPDLDDTEFFLGVGEELEDGALAEWQQLLREHPEWVDTRKQSDLEEEYVNAS
jgi:hypothetical protein